MTRVKLCGLRRECDVEAVNELKPEFAGFILSTPFKRYVEPETVLEFRKKLTADTKMVGVFVDEELDYVKDILLRDIVDVAQLHGHETNEYIENLKKLINKPVIKAFKIEKEEDIKLAAECKADYVLLDSGTGTGKKFNWELIKNIDRPYILAGGLDPDNVGEAVRTLHPFAVDVSSGIETDGFKDKDKMKAFVLNVRKEK